MSDLQFDAFINTVYTLQTTDAMDDAFRSVIQTLSPEDKTRLGKKLEQIFLSSYPFENNIRKMGPVAFKDALESADSLTINGQHLSVREAIRVSQLRNQLFSYIDELLGNAASPLAKAFNGAAASLTKPEYNSRDVFRKPAAALADAIADQEGLYKDNPLRQKKEAKLLAAARAHMGAPA